MPFRSFREVPGWREAFAEAAQRLDEVRTGSLFGDVTLDLCGERVRTFTLSDWVLLDDAKNPFFSGGKPTVAHALKVLWIVHHEYAPRGFFSNRRQARMFARVLRRYRMNLDALIDDVFDFVDDAFLDMPGRYATGSARGMSPTKWPRKHYAIDLAAEIMQRFPSFSFKALRSMPLAQFWQWLHAARACSDSEYRNYQETDAVNAAACAELNRINKQEREAQAAAEKN